MASETLHPGNIIPFPIGQNPQVEAWVRHFVAKHAWPRDPASVAHLRAVLSKSFVDCSEPPPGSSRSATAEGAVGVDGNVVLAFPRKPPSKGMDAARAHAAAKGYGEVPPALAAKLERHIAKREAAAKQDIIAAPRKSPKPRKPRVKRSPE